jgi:hypothetical protein
MSACIEDYAMVDDGETAALIGPSGSVDPHCRPPFDSAYNLGAPEHIKPVRQRGAHQRPV